MDFETYLREKVRVPAYGTAPGGLVDAHREIIRQMRRLYRAGVSLASGQMLELAGKADELSAEITEFNERKT